MTLRAQRGGLSRLDRLRRAVGGDGRTAPRTERVSLKDGRWADVFVRRSDRRPGPDYNAYLRSLLASFVARSSVTGSDGRAIDTADPAQWSVLSRAELAEIAAAVVALVRKGRIEDDV